MSAKRVDGCSTERSGHAMGQVAIPRGPPGAHCHIESTVDRLSNDGGHHSASRWIRFDLIHTIHKEGWPSVQVEVQACDRLRPGPGGIEEHDRPWVGTMAQVA